MIEKPSKPIPRKEMRLQQIDARLRSASVLWEVAQRDLQTARAEYERAPNVEEKRQLQFMVNSERTAHWKVERYTQQRQRLLEKELRVPRGIKPPA